MRFLITEHNSFGFVYALTVDIDVGRNSLYAFFENPRML